MERILLAEVLVLGNIPLQYSLRLIIRYRSLNGCPRGKRIPHAFALHTGKAPLSNRDLPMVEMGSIGLNALETQLFLRSCSKYGAIVSSELHKKRGWQILYRTRFQGTCKWLICLTRRRENSCNYMPHW